MKLFKCFVIVVILLGGGMLMIFENDPPEKPAGISASAGYAYLGEWSEVSTPAMPALRVALTEAERNRPEVNRVEHVEVEHMAYRLPPGSVSLTYAAAMDEPQEMPTIELLKPNDENPLLDDRLKAIEDNLVGQIGECEAEISRLTSIVDDLVSRIDDDKKTAETAAQEPTADSSDQSQVQYQTEVYYEEVCGPFGTCRLVPRYRQVAVAANPVPDEAAPVAEVVQSQPVQVLADVGQYYYPQTGQSVQLFDNQNFYQSDRRFRTPVRTTARRFFGALRQMRLNRIQRRCQRFGFCN